MKNEKELKIYLLAQRTLQNEWLSLLGDKFRNALGFAWTFTDKITDADVVAWDGLMNVKAAYYLAPVVSSLQTGKQVLLLQYEAHTLFKEDPFLTSLDVSNIRHVELLGGNVLPEDLLAAIVRCREKLYNV